LQNYIALQFCNVLRACVHAYQRVGLHPLRKAFQYSDDIICYRFIIVTKLSAPDSFLPVLEFRISESTPLLSIAAVFINFCAMGYFASNYLFFVLRILRKIFSASDSKQLFIYHYYLQPFYSEQVCQVYFVIA
jgi:hypothetical protein